jgi:hypothetical protein
MTAVPKQNAGQRDSSGTRHDKDDQRRNRG